MICGKCKAQIPDNSPVCPYCGAQQAQPTYQQPYAQQGYQQPTYQQPAYPQRNYQQSAYPQQNYQQPVNPQQNYRQPYQQSSLQNAGLPMNWHKFLVCFGLWVCAAFSLLCAVLMFTGAQYGEYSTLLYTCIPGQKLADVIFGILLVGVAALSCTVAFQLLKRRQGAPKLLTLLFLFSAVVSLLYTVATILVLTNYGADLSEMTVILAAVVSSLAVSVVMIIANNVYYKKRAHLFVN